MSDRCYGRCLDDEEAIEVVEWLGLAQEMAKTADSFMAAALERVCGISTDTTGLRRDAARLRAMLSAVARPVEPTPWDQP